MKFDLKMWLMYSALIGFWAGLIIFCISLVMLELPAPLAFLIGISVALAIGFAIEISHISKEKKVEAERMAKAKRDFYLSCRSARFSSEYDLESPEKKQLLQQIANKYNIPYSSFNELVKLYQDEEQKYSAEQHQASIAWQKEHEIEKERQKQRRAAKLAEEQQQLAVFTRFANDHGAEKTLHMLDAELASLESRIQDSMTTPPAMLSKQKESDGMFAAGTAYGIGGVIPAAASLARTEQKNAQIRQANAQIDQINSALVGAVAVANADRMRCAARMKNFRNDFFKKCSLFQIDESTETIFSHLKFSHTESIVSETGSITVKTKVSTDGKIRAFGKAAYADGSIIAGIYSGGVKIGEATLVLPILGTGNLHYRKRVLGWQGNDETIELSGICLSCGAVPTLSYTVRFAPGDLWAINQSWF